jgi:hypothetical protein
MSSQLACWASYRYNGATVRLDLDVRAAMEPPLIGGTAWPGLGLGKVPERWLSRLR